MSKKVIEVHVDKDSKIDFKEFIEMKIKYDEEYFKKDKENQRLYIALRNREQEIERLNNIIEDFEIELQREINIKEEDTSLEENTFITINNTLKTVLKRFRELKGSNKENV